MFKQYEEKLWMSAINFLNKEMKMDAFEIYTLLRCKDMRWACNDDPAGKISENTIKRYLAKESVLKDIKIFLKESKNNPSLVGDFEKMWVKK